MVGAPLAQGPGLGASLPMQTVCRRALGAGSMAGGGWGYSASANPFATTQADDVDTARPAATGAWGNAPAPPMVPLEVQQAAAAAAPKRSGLFGALGGGSSKNTSAATAAALAAAPAVAAYGASSATDLARREQELTRREQDVARREAALGGAGGAGVVGGKRVVSRPGRLTPWGLLAALLAAAGAWRWAPGGGGGGGGGSTVAWKAARRALLPSPAGPWMAQGACLTLPLPSACRIFRRSVRSCTTTSAWRSRPGRGAGGRRRGPVSGVGAWCFSGVGACAGRGRGMATGTPYCTTPPTPRDGQRQGVPHAPPCWHRRARSTPPFAPRPRPPLRSPMRFAFMNELLVLLGFFYNTLITLIAMFANAYITTRWWLIALIAFLIGVPASWWMW